MYLASNGAGAAFLPGAGDVRLGRDLLGLVVDHVDLVAHERLPPQQQQGLADLPGPRAEAGDDAVVLEDPHLAPHGVFHDLAAHLVAHDQLLGGDVLQQVCFGKQRQAHAAQQVGQLAVPALHVGPDPVDHGLVHQALVLHLQFLAEDQLLDFVFGQTEEVLGLEQGIKVGQAHSPGQLVQPLALVGVREQHHPQTVGLVEVLFQELRRRVPDVVELKHVAGFQERLCVLLVDDDAGRVGVVEQQLQHLRVERVVEVDVGVPALSQPATEHGLKVAAAGGQHGPVAGEGAAPGLQNHVREDFSFAQQIELSQEAVCVGSLVEKLDVHGSRTGPRLPVLVAAERHLDLESEWTE